MITPNMRNAALSIHNHLKDAGLNPFTDEYPNQGRVITSTSDTFITVTEKFILLDIGGKLLKALTTVDALDYINTELLTPKRKMIALRLNGVALAWFVSMNAAIKAAKLVKEHMGVDFTPTHINIHTVTHGRMLLKHELDYLLHVYPEVFQESPPVMMEGRDRVSFKVSQQVYDLIGKTTHQITITNGLEAKVL